VVDEYEVNTEHLWNDSDRGNPNYSETNLSQFHIMS